ncbi:hypothetical protein QR510_30260, partial [Escherichia coli]|uniref:hypothetical protein n=1 Tax=Escherichia coli TaxID=562 RepID=UPI00273852F1
VILWLTIQKTPFVVRTPSGEVFKRLNASDQRVEGSALTKLELDKGVVSAEDQRTDVPPSDISATKIGATFRQNLVPEMDME